GAHIFYCAAPPPALVAQGCRSLSLGGAASPRFPPAGHPNAGAALGTPGVARAAGASLARGAPPPARADADASPRMSLSSARPATPARPQARSYGAVPSLGG